MPMPNLCLDRNRSRRCGQKPSGVGVQLPRPAAASKTAAVLADSRRWIAADCTGADDTQSASSVRVRGGSSAVCLLGYDLFDSGIDSGKVLCLQISESAAK